MPKKDINQLAKFLSDQAKGEIPPAPEESARVIASRKGGLKGGAARAVKLTPEERTIIAKKAATARWKTDETK